MYMKVNSVVNRIEFGKSLEAEYSWLSSVILLHLDCGVQLTQDAENMLAQIAVDPSCDETFSSVVHSQTKKDRYGFTQLMPGEAEQVLEFVKLKVQGQRLMVSVGVSRSGALRSNKA